MNTNKKGDWASGKMKMTAVAHFYGNEEQRQALLDLVIESIFVQAIHPYNQYLTPKKKDWVNRLSNVGSVYFANVSGGAKVHGWIDLLLKFNDKWGKGPYNCGAAIEMTSNMMKGDICPKLAKAHNIPFFDPFVICRPDLEHQGD